MRPRPQPRTALPGALASLLRQRAIECVYQPIVSLADRGLVGFEALARGPRGSVWHDPAAFIAAASRAGRLSEVDWICRAAACRGALAAGLPPGTPLFVNIEPATPPATCPPDLEEVIQEAGSRLQIVAEVTERAVADDPARLLTTTDRLRHESALIALDDVGANPASQAMMPLLAPDVIKIDRSVVQAPARDGAAAVIAAVQAEALHSGAVILAEGIQSRRDLEVATSIGATLGQGFYLGRPGPIPPSVATSMAVFPRRTSVPAVAETPFETARVHRSPSRVSVRTMLLLSRSLEDRDALGGPAMLLATFQDARHFDPVTRRRYSDLSDQTVLTAVFGRNMTAEPAPNVRGYPLSADDILATEWTVLVIGRRPAGIFARQTTGSDPRTFDVIASDDRGLVLAAARSLIERMPANAARELAADGADTAQPPADAVTAAMIIQSAYGDVRM